MCYHRTMTRRFAILASIVFSIFALVSCGFNIPVENVGFDITDILPDGLEANIGKRTLVFIENAKLTDALYVVESDSPETISQRGTVTKYLFKTQGNGYIIIPDQKKHAEFFGSEIGLEVYKDIEIGHFGNIDTDLEISSSEEKYADLAVGDLLEELCFIDFNDSKWSDLDPSRVCVMGPSDDTMGFSVLQFNDYDKAKKGLMDFTGLKDFAIYLFREVDELGFSKSATCRVFTPKTLNLDIGSEQVTEQFDALDVELDDGKYYTLSVQCPEQENIKSFLNSVESRYYDGTKRSMPLIPVIDKAGNTIAFHTGKADKPFLMRFLLEDNPSGSYLFSCNQIESTQYPEIIKVEAIPSSNSIEVPVTETEANSYKTILMDLKGHSETALSCPEAILTSKTGDMWILVVDCRTKISGDKVTISFK